MSKIEINLPSLSPESHIPSSPAGKRLMSVRQRILLATNQRPPHFQPVILAANGRGILADPVSEMAALGVKDFVEEYLPEGIAKRPVVDHKVQGLTWHYAGLLDSKKMSLAVEFFDVLHCFDKVTLIKPLRDALAKHPKKLGLYLEINPLGVKKSVGASPQDIPLLMEALSKIPHIRVLGLSFKNEKFLQADDRRLAYQEMQKLAQDYKFIELAMGGSQDLELALQHGATLLRIRDALFGIHTQHSMSNVVEG